MGSSDDPRKKPVQRGHVASALTQSLSDTAPHASSALGFSNTTPAGGSGEILAQTLTLTAGAHIHQYELIRELGRGGMGQVWAARDTRLGRRVAMKFLLNATRGVADRFLVEARATAQCNHENIVIIHQVDELDETPYMVLEYLEGQTLRELMTSSGKLPVSRVVELALPIARALARAHELGIVHRDLKPENVIVTNAGQVKVLDFGIAKALEKRKELPTSAFDGTVVEIAKPATLNVTGHDTILGTLPYMAPEQMTNDDVDERADLWALGVMMFEMLAGHHPVQPLSMEALITNATSPDEPMPALRDAVPEANEAIAAIVASCLEKVQYRRVATAQELVPRLEELRPGARGRRLGSGESPYPGLTAFQEADADRFFGRSRDVTRMVAKLREHPITGVVGPSGVGKSSFVRAGVGPALKSSGEAWEILTLRPGKQPLAALAAVVDKLGRPSARTLDTEGTASRLRSEPGLLGTQLRAYARQTSTHILLFVDQFEELYTLVPDVAERRAFTTALAAVADDASTPLRVVLSMRSDFLDRVAEDAHLLEELSRGLVFLPPPDAEGLREALVAPLELVGHKFESAVMVEDMLDSLANVPGALPLLQFAAATLWDMRDRERKLLTVSSYNAMDGVSGALAKHADTVLASMNAASQKLTQKIFRRLVTPERTRAIVELTDVQQLESARTEVSRVLDALVAARLLIVQTRGDGGGGTVEIVHESLITSWPTLRRWLDEDQDDAAYLAQVAAAAKQWDSKGRPQGLLWRGDAMEEARRWHALRPRELGTREKAFLDDVFALADRGVRARRTAVIGGFALLGAIAAAALVAVVWIRGAERQARDNELAARNALTQMKQKEAERQEAEARKAAAEASQATALENMRKAQNVAEQTGADLALSREELQKKNADLVKALADAKAAQAQAERASSVAQQKTAEAVQAKTQLQQALAEKTARIKELEAERKKIVTKLKD